MSGPEGKRQSYCEAPPPQRTLRPVAEDAPGDAPRDALWRRSLETLSKVVPLRDSTVAIAGSVRSDPILTVR